MAEATRASEASRAIDHMSQMTQNIDIQGKLKEVSDTASEVMSKTQSNLRQIGNRGREVFNRATGRMTNRSWVSLGLGVFTVSLAVYFARRNRESNSSVRDLVE